MIRRAIATEMKRRDWTAYRLSQEARVSPDPIYKFLAGTREITTATLEPVLKALGLTIGNAGTR